MFKIAANMMTIKTDDIETIKMLVGRGELYSLKLTFSIIHWRFMYVGKWQAK